MNDKLKELYAVASLYACNQLGHENEHCGKTLAEVATEKFAELIVRDCAAKAWWAEQYNMGNGKPISEQIAEHFGVKS